MSLQSDRDEVRAKVLMVLNSIGKPVTVGELMTNPLLDGMTPHGIGAHLRTLANLKEVRRNPKGKTWAPIRSREVPATRTDVPTNMCFVINAAQRTIMLDVGGLRLPVMVE